MHQRNRVFNTSDCIESARIEKYHSDKQLNDNFSSHTQNDDDDAFNQYLEKQGVGEVFSYQSEPVTRELRDYIEDWEKNLMKKND